MIGPYHYIRTLWSWQLIEFQEAVPKIKYEHIFEEEVLNWRHLKPIRTCLFAGELVVLVGLVVLAVSGVQHVDCNTFRRQSQEKEKDQENEKEKEKDK